MGNQQRIELTITGMHCGGCVRRVTGALSALEGLADLTVEVGKAHFSADDDQAVAAAGQAVEALGFGVANSQRSPS
jgi:copper chaperone CopZ